MKNKLKTTCSGIIAVLKHEGLGSLISRTTSYIMRRLFLIDNYYVSRSIVADMPVENEEDFSPKADNFEARMISTNREADELVAEGFDLGAYGINLRASLDTGALSVCIFVDKELAHINCIADNENGRNVIDPRPFHIDFEKGDIVGGRAITVPKYRRLHLRAYSGYLLRKYFRENGYVYTTGTLGVNNYPALANAARLNITRIVSKCRYIKILGFSHFTEVPMEPTQPSEIVARMSYHKKK